MRKKLVMLACVMGMALVPSIGVLASEPGETPTVETPTVETPTVETSTGGSVQDGNVIETYEVVPDVNGTIAGSDNVVPDANVTVAGSDNVVPDANVTVAGSDNVVPDVNETVTDMNESTTDINSMAADTNAVETDQSTSGMEIQMDPELVYDGTCKVIIGCGDNEPVILEGDGEYQGDTGTILWTESTHTLEFKDFGIEVVSPNGSFQVDISSGGEVTLILTGDSYLVAKDGDAAIYCWGQTMNIVGGGSLTTEAQHSSIGVQDGSLNIEDVALELNSTNGSDEFFARGLGCITINMDDWSSFDEGIHITDSTVKGENMAIMSMGKASFNGDTNVEATGVNGMPGITSFGEMTFKLSGKGMVTSAVQGQPYMEGMILSSVASYKGIEMLNGNKLVSPADGMIVSVTYENGMPVYYFANPDGTPAMKTVVAGKTTAQAITTDTELSISAASVGGVSAKTGDSTQAGRLLLLLFAAAGCMAVVLKKRGFAAR